MKEADLILGAETAARVTALLLGMIVFRLASYHPERIVFKSCVELSGMIRARQKKSVWYHRTQIHLLRNGAEFHYGKWMSPAAYLTVRILCALLGFFIIEGIATGYGILVAVLFFFLPDWLLLYLNKKDNERMLAEIKLVYHALEIQIRAGVYVTDALAECYGSVQEPRLQQALLDLAGDIVMKADIYEALERFQGRFDNRYIDSLCITILQACESGQAVELLSDISEQIKDMEATVMNRKKSSLDRSITFYQLGMLVAVLGVIIYACVSYLFSAATKL